MHKHSTQWVSSSLVRCGPFVQFWFRCVHVRTTDCVHVNQKNAKHKTQQNDTKAFSFKDYNDDEHDTDVALCLWA